MKNIERPEVIEAMVHYFSSRGKQISNLKLSIGYTGRFWEKDFETWANSEYVEPFKITEAEKRILDVLYKYSVNDGSITRYTGYEGIALVTPWDTYEMPFYNHLFDWIKEGETYGIKYILENCEVIDDASETTK